MSYAPARIVDFREVPIIDMAPLVAGDAAGIAAVGRLIHAAAVEVGFFYIRGHGVDPAVIAAAHDAGRAFFALPEAAKQEAAISPIHRGYLRPGEARMYGREQPDLKESFIFGLDLPAEDPDVRAGKPLMGPNRWPPALPEMRPALERYFDAACGCGRRLLAGFAVALGLAPDFFAASFAKPLARGAVIHYPPQPPDLGATRFGVAPHSDYGCLTLLWQDANGGLQVRNRAGEWIAAPPLGDSFVVNIGDLMARWTNDLYASTPHRVVNRSGRERYSMPVFIDPHPDTDITVLAPCRRPGEPPRHPPTTCGAYIKARFDEAFRYRQK